MIDIHDLYTMKHFYHKCNKKLLTFENKPKKSGHLAMTTLGMSRMTRPPFTYRLTDFVNSSSYQTVVE